MSVDDSITRHNATNEAIGIGKLIKGPGARDAVHVAVYPCTAGEVLNRGESVTIIGGEAYGETTKGERIGIVDPFLNCAQVPASARFYVFLTPGTITGLRHEWSHPAFDEMDRSMAWMEDFAGKHGFTAKEVIKAGLEREETLNAQESFLDTPDEYWEHLENISGQKIRPGDRNNIFRCC